MIKKKYVQPSVSSMDNVPNWDAVKPARMFSNPSVVNVDGAKTLKEETDKSEVQNLKKYVQPASSLMDNAPDWDAVKPAVTSSNPSVVNVDVTKPKGEVKDESVIDEPKKKKYVRPSASLMENTPDWDAVLPALSTSNPSVVSVIGSSRPVVNTHDRKKKKEEVLIEEPKKQRYIKPSVSMMDSAPDWNAVKPALSTSNPSVVSVDGINRIGEGKRFVRPPSASLEVEIDQKTRPAPADKPFEYKQVQSIPKENPAGAKPVQDEEAKTKLPASIAHAAGSSSDGWTPSAHFPTDDTTNSLRIQDSNPKGKRTISAQSSTMEHFDPDALPRPTGVIPLTVSSSAREKTELFREEHSLEPEEEDKEAENIDGKDEVVATPTQKESSLSESGKKKLFLYDGGNPQPKEPWEFSMEGFDMKLDQSQQQEMSTTKNKLIAYDKNSGTKGTIYSAEDSTKQKQKKNAENGNFRHSDQGRKLQEKTVSPFTRTVSDMKEPSEASVTKQVDSTNKDSDSINAESKDV